MQGRTNWLCRAVCTAVVFVSPASAVWAVNIETVPVGSLGNAGDTEVMLDGTTGYGAVDYAYSMGKYEVTVGQYCEFLNAVARVDTYGLYSTFMWHDIGRQIERYAGSGTPTDPYSYRVAADWANRPVNRVSWGDAARFCNWLHNGQPTGLQTLTTTEDGAYYLNGAMGDLALGGVTREADCKWALPTEDEWYKAAYYIPGTGTYCDYPTGTDAPPSNDLIDPDPGNNATFWGGESDFTISELYMRTEVGAHENSGSPWGTFDQGGNVREWGETIMYDMMDWPWRDLRGGGYYNLSGILHAKYRDWCWPEFEGDDIGFRVCQVPEPGSLILLALGGMALLRRLHRRPAAAAEGFSSTAAPCTPCTTEGRGLRPICRRGHC